MGLYGAIMRQRPITPVTRRPGAGGGGRRQPGQAVRRDDYASQTNYPLPGRAGRTGGQGGQLCRHPGRRRPGGAGHDTTPSRARTRSSFWTSPPPTRPARPWPTWWRTTAQQVFVPLTVGGGIRTLGGLPGSCCGRGRTRSASTPPRCRIPRSSPGRRSGSAASAWCWPSTPGAGRTAAMRWWSTGGRTPTGLDAIEWAGTGRALGAGEILAHLHGRRRHQDGLRPGHDPRCHQCRPHPGYRLRRLWERWSTLPRRVYRRRTPTPRWQRPCSTSGTDCAPGEGLFEDPRHTRCGEGMAVYDRNQRFIRQIRPDPGDHPGCGRPRIS